MRKLGSFLVVLSVLVAMPQTAFAGGLFYAGSGTRPLGRGAAFHVRADDPMALLYNPAKLADLNGTQFLANFNLALLDACMDPTGTAERGGSSASNPDGALRDRGTYKENYAPSSSGDADITRFGVVPAAANKDLRKSWLGTTMPKVCNETGLLPIPNFVLTYQFIKPASARPNLKGLTVAFGMVAPGAVAKTNWGKPDGSVRAKRHATQAEVDAAAPDGSGLGKPLPPGVRPDAVCDPSTEDCSMYCNPETDLSCPSGRQYFCDPSKFDCNALPTPTRYLLVEQDPFAIPLTLGVGYRPLSWLAVGAAFTYQAVFFKSVVYATQTANSIPELDMRVENELNDWFVPVINASVAITPMQGLDLMAYYKWQDKIAGETKTTITDGAYTIGGQAGRLPVTTVIEAGEGLETEVPQPWEVGAGLRFALSRSGFSTTAEPDTRLDPMLSEVFDIEFNYVLEHNSSVDQLTLRSIENPFKVFQGYDADGDPDRDGSVDPLDPNCSTLPGPPTNISGCTSELRFLKQMNIRRNWKNQHVFRVGGDYNVIPGILALRAGWNLETRGVDPAFQGVDAFPSRRMGVHGGLTWRIRSIDISLAYAHLFQETIQVVHRDAVDAQGNALPDRAGVKSSALDSSSLEVNAGTYRVSWDVFSIGMTQRF